MILSVETHALSTTNAFRSLDMGIFRIEISNRLRGPDTSEGQTRD